MSGLESLESLIYHEKQQAGSMLCAQHALNSLLQGNYFTAPDLSDIARGLDDLEESYDDSNPGGTSTNMDDTGFFSVQVLDNALKVWGLNLTRWRGEEMRPFHDHPQTQLAFILNLEQHWFTLRRFGNTSPDVGTNGNDGHWFNLNSALPSPEWVGKLYLGMVLQQAEADGYSIFAVTPADPLAPTALPRTDADEIAATLDEPRSSGRPNYQASGTARMPPGNSGFEEEDYELQAALQASLMNPDAIGATPLGLPNHLPSITRSQAPLSGFQPDPPSGSVSGTLTPLQLDHIAPPSSVPLQLPGHADLDPVAASIERNRVMLQRMREQQEFAQRELWAETGAMEPSHLSVANDARRREREEEEDNLRRAIQESEALAKAEGHGRPEKSGHETTNMTTQNSFPIIGPSDEHRVYDDDDAELQAALKASLEQVPAGWEPSQWSPKPSTDAPGSSIIESAPSHSITRDRELNDDESVISEGTNTTEDLTSDARLSQESVSVDELRKRRLARFGA